MAGANNAQAKAQGHSAKQIAKHRATHPGPLVLADMAKKKAPALRQKVQARVEATAPKPFAMHDPAARRSMANDALAAARSVHGDGRWGEHKVFVSAAWDALKASGKTRGMRLPEFKELLVKANRDGHLRLSRADLVEAMDQWKLHRSRIDSMGANFQFIRTD